MYKLNRFTFMTTVESYNYSIRCFSQNMCMAIINSTCSKYRKYLILMQLTQAIHIDLQ